MKKVSQILFLAIFMLPLGKVHALEKYAGEWTMVSMKFQVTVDSWGEHCGLRPSSYSNDKKVSVVIKSKGKHLIFSKGNLRTDRCGSPNPRLRTLSSSATDGRWVRVCETESNDSKYEHGKYTLVAKSPDKLVYTAESKFDWTLQNDHCIARSVERRVYVRVKTGGSSEPTQPPPPPEPALDDWDEPTPTPGGSQPQCESSGLPKRIIVQPKRLELGPGERSCFKATAIDAAGCSHTITPKWQVSQGGHQVKGLINPAGCFIAGDTAADSEGLYNVTAKYRGKTDAVEVLVVFPDIAELLAARLRPLEDISSLDPAPESPPTEKTPDAENDTPEVAKTGSPAGIPSVLPQNTQKKESKTGKWIIFIVIGIVLIAGAGLLIFAIRKKSYERRQSSADFSDWLDEVDKTDEFRSEISSDEPLTDKKTGGGKKSNICPKCNGSFPSEARFCPEDGSILKSENDDDLEGPRSSSVLMTDGKVCPKCHRGYDMSASYCPHDSELLVPYSEWRAKK